MGVNNSMIVAMADLKMAMKVRYVRYSLIMVGLLGPVMTIAMMLLTFGFISPASPEYSLMVAIMLPMGASLLALISAIPASLIAANAIIGEKEQKTLEPLLATPLTDRELIWGKTLSALIPSVILLYGGTLITTVSIYVGLMIMGQPPIIFPDLPGMFLIFCAGPAVVFAVVSIMIIISERVSRVYEAYQTGTLAVMVLLIPMFGSFTSFDTGVADQSGVWFTNILTFLLAATIAIITWFIALRVFNRDHLISMV